MLQLWGPGIAQLFSLQPSPRPLQYRQGTDGICWHFMQIGLSFSLPLLQCTVLVSPAAEPQDSSSHVTLFSRSSTLFPPTFLLSLPRASQPLYRESPLSVILHLWAVNKRSTSVPFGGWCKHHLHIPSLQKQLVAEEACQHFRCMLFCFPCFDEIHL